MKSFNKFLSEGKKDYEVYHKSFTAAWEEVKRFVATNGFSMNESDVTSQVERGGSSGRARPGPGKTNKFSIRLDLLKDGKPTKRTVQFQVYGMESRNELYELNMYIG